MHELRELCGELWADRRRLRLVVIALAWGTLGLTVLAGFGEGFDRAMRSVLTQSGDRMVRVQPGATSRPFEGRAAGRIVELDARAIAAIRAEPAFVRASEEYVAGGRILVEGNSRTASIRGVDQDFARIRGLRLSPAGRFLSELDVRDRRRVVVLGATLARHLFGSRDAIGRTVRIGTQPYRVVGLVMPRATVSNYDGDDDGKAFVPSTTLLAVSNVRWPSYVVAELSDPQEHTEVVARLRDKLGSVLGFDPRDDRAIRVADYVAMTDRILALVVGSRWFLLAVGVLGLCVAAVGIGNSMHALVLERTAETGLCMALGATRAQIMSKPLLESLVLVMVGGGVGFAAGLLLLAGIDALPLPSSMREYLGSPLPSPSLAGGVAVLLGLVAAIAGIAPARRAASVEPIVALRAE
jgi:putative ABC transport system permease protein